MRTISISDITLKQKEAAQLTFREKLELAKLLDKLGADVIETEKIIKPTADSLLLKSIAQIVGSSIIAVPVTFDRSNADEAAAALKDAGHARLQVVCPASSVQIEYLYHEKPDAMIEKVAEMTAYCRTLVDDVELIAADATRAEKGFLCRLIDAAVGSGAGTVTVCDDAGSMLPDEFAEFIRDVRNGCEGLKPGKDSAVRLGAACSNKLSAADMCCFNGILEGADEIKASVHPESTAALRNLVKLIDVKGEKYGIAHSIKTVEIKRLLGQADKLFTEYKNKHSLFDDGVRDDREEKVFNVHDGIDVIINEIARLGYDLSEEDNTKVYETFSRVASRKESVTSKEIDAIIASSALQVPPTYKIEDFIINSGNVISATSHMRLLKEGKILESVAVGDGPVDASFRAIEQITGHHYELDDFQIQSVTEGRAAMGETIVKLRNSGKLYSGRGISTDIVGSSILAYINALNKIVYEEENS